jgi:hypothetical protein
MRAKETVSDSSLRFVQAAVGALLCIGAVRFWANGWVDELLLTEGLRLHYYGFGWVVHPGKTGCLLLLLVTAASGVLMVFGRGGRWSLAAAFLSFTWTELIEASTYLNHYYFVSALLLLLWSLPTPSGFRRGGEARVVARTVPRWVVWAVRAQVAAVYLHAGIAKLNPDWLVRGEPLRTWLMVRSELPVIGPLLPHELTALVFAWGGAFYDLTIVGWLSWRRTRPVAWFGVVVFHVVTAILFRIGLFPWIMIGVSTVFFAPDWWGALARWCRARLGLCAIASSGAPCAHPAPLGWPAWPALVLLLVQFALPQRQWLYPGNRLWTEQGFRFAWNVMLVEKVGHMEFLVVSHTTGKHRRTSGAEQLTPLQRRVASTQPDLLLQVAHAVGHRARERGGTEVAVYADVWVSMNGRLRQRFVDPGVDLMKVTDGFGPKDWVLPLAAP